MLGKPKIYSIPPTACFVDALAFGILEDAQKKSISLTDYTILLPNRRAQRTLREAFLNLAGDKPMLLPSMRPIGDVDEDEVEFLGAGLVGVDRSGFLPAISSTRRLVILTKILVEQSFPVRASPAQAWRLARELSRFMDQVAAEGLNYNDLEKLVPEGLAEHWEVTLDFLQILTRTWPDILQSQNMVDLVTRRDMLIRALCEIWRVKPPEGPIIAAGSTGSVPVTAELLGLVSRLENGCVVLPGFDGSLDDYAWQNVGPTHPQNAMKALLEKMAINRHEVNEWQLPPQPLREKQQARYDLISDALRPAYNTDIWPNLAYRSMPTQELFDGVSKVVAPSRREEAEAIAVIMREALEVPGKTAALVTPDRYLARYVRMALKRWYIDIDDSGGDRALISSTGRFMSLIAHAAASDFSPVAFLSLLQHPMIAAGYERPKFLAFVRRFDLNIMRGARPKAGIDGIIERAKQAIADPVVQFNQDDLTYLLKVCDVLTPIISGFNSATVLSDIIKIHLEVAEGLAAITSGGLLIPGGKTLWKGDAGAAISKRLRDLISDNQDIHLAEKVALNPEEYAALFDEMLSDVMVRPLWKKHPRLSIWGPLEARLQNTDLMILGGLNEGVWPSDIKPDPWMSKSMRDEFGLPALERRIGQSAHDFVQAVCAPNVIITRAEKVDGSPTVPSRWLFRIEALAGQEIPRKNYYLDWAKALSMPDKVQPVKPPSPTPPLDARPKKLSVTQIETWMRDPYSIYASKILNLKPLQQIDERPNAAQKGTLIHKAFERFMKLENQLKGEAGYHQLVEIGKDVFQEIIGQPTVYAFWWPRFKDAARWFIDHEERWQKNYETILLEEKAELRLTEHDFTLTATADRIDRNRRTNELAIIDYKTGNIPTEKRMRAGYAPQLPLEGVLAEKGAFKTIEAANVERLLFWLIKGGAEPGEIQEKIKKLDISDTILDAEQGLRALITAFASEATPYLSNPRPKHTGYGDYDHLSRVKEWQADEIDGEGDGI